MVELLDNCFESLYFQWKDWLAFHGLHTFFEVECYDLRVAHLIG